MKAPLNKSSVAVAFAVTGMLLASWVNAKPMREKTADRYVREQGITCIYGKPRFETDTDGRSVVVTHKRCEASSR